VNGLRRGGGLHLVYAGDTIGALRVRARCALDAATDAHARIAAWVVVPTLGASMIRFSPVLGSVLVTAGTSSARVSDRARAFALLLALPRVGLLVGLGRRFAHGCGGLMLV
jgi:hypothetical protein